MLGRWGAGIRARAGRLRRGGLCGRGDCRIGRGDCRLARSVLGGGQRLVTWRHRLWRSRCPGREQTGPPQGGVQMLNWDASRVTPTWQRSTRARA